MRKSLINVLFGTRTETPVRYGHGHIPWQCACWLSLLHRLCGAAASGGAAGPLVENVGFRSWQAPQVLCQFLTRQRSIGFCESPSPEQVAGRGTDKATVLRAKTSVSSSSANKEFDSFRNGNIGKCRK